MAHVTDPPQPLVALKISDTNFFLYYYNYHHYCRSIHLTFLHKKNTNNLHQSSWAATTFDWAPSKTCQHHLLVCSENLFLLIKILCDDYASVQILVNWKKKFCQQNTGFLVKKIIFDKNLIGGYSFLTCWGGWQLCRQNWNRREN